jgi:hypothetical protein
LSVHIDLATFTRTLGFRPRAKQAGHVEPHVEAYSVRLVFVHVN